MLLRHSDSACCQFGAKEQGSRCPRAHLGRRFQARPARACRLSRARFRRRSARSGLGRIEADAGTADRFGHRRQHDSPCALLGQSIVGEEVAPSVHLEELLATAVLLVGASAAAIVLSRRAGLGTVIGLIAVGIVLGPYTPGPVIDIAPVTAAAEIGVVLLLFVLGLEIEPQRLWAMRRMLFGLGTLQVLTSGVVLALVALAFGRPWPAALIAGFGLSLSSTAFVLQLLAERGEFGTAHGRAAFAVLLLQDMMVVPLLALVPLLAPAPPATVPRLCLGCCWRRPARWPCSPSSASWPCRGRWPCSPGSATAKPSPPSRPVGAAGGLVSRGRPVAGAGRLPARRSAFRSPLHHQIAAEILPFKGLLLGLFFILIGMSIDLGALAAGWPGSWPRWWCWSRSRPRSCSACAECSVWRCRPPCARRCCWSRAASSDSCCSAPRGRRQSSTGVLHHAAPGHLGLDGATPIVVRLGDPARGAAGRGGTGAGASGDPAAD